MPTVNLQVHTEETVRSVNRTVDGWSESDKTPNTEQVLGNPDVNVDTVECSDIT